MSYKPHTMFMTVAGREIPYQVRTQQAADWYDPLKPYTQLEYDWVAENIPLDGQTVIDAGCHQGNYAAVFAAFGAHVYAIDAHPENCEIVRNFVLSDDHQVINRAVWNRSGAVQFSGVSNGKVTDNGIGVMAMRLSDCPQSASVVKLDVEGAEFVILPDSIDNMPNINWWIVEVHPTDGDPMIIADLFYERGYQLWKVDREQMRVLPYNMAHDWPTHATLIARKVSNE